MTASCARCGATGRALVPIADGRHACTTCRDSDDLAWLPTQGAKLVPCGTYWDAVRVPRDLGERALDVLGDKTGPVIESYPDLRLVWLVPPGTLHHHPPAYRVYGQGCRIEIPCTDPDENLWLTWRIPPSGDCLTDPHALRRALDAVLPPAAETER